MSNSIRTANAMPQLQLVDLHTGHIPSFHNFEEKGIYWHILKDLSQDTILLIIFVIFKIISYSLYFFRRLLFKKLNVQP